MYNVGQSFISLMNSNIRPKCEPEIAVEIGEEEIKWKAKDIVSVRFEKSIDPIGRDLPFMRLVWDEILVEKLSESAYPEKYNNIIAYLPVSFKMIQHLSFSGSDVQEVNYPPLFLSGKPEIKNNIIEWTAFGVANFLEEPEKRSFPRKAYEKCIAETMLLDSRAPFGYSLPLFEAMTESARNLPEIYRVQNVFCTCEIVSRETLDSAVANHFEDIFIYYSNGSWIYKDSDDEYDVSLSEFGLSVTNVDLEGFARYASTLTAAQIAEMDHFGIYILIHKQIENELICDNFSGSILKDRLSCRNLYLDHGGNGIVAKRIFEGFQQTPFSFPLALQYSAPSITKGRDVASFSSKMYTAKNTAIPEIKYPDSVTIFPDLNSQKNVALMEYDYGGYGESHYVECSISSSSISLLDIDRKKYVEAISETISPYTGQESAFPELKTFTRYEEGGDSGWRDESGVEAFPEGYGVRYSGYPAAGDTITVTFYRVLGAIDRRSSAHVIAANETFDPKNYPIWLYKKSVDSISETKVFDYTGEQYSEDNGLNDIPLSEREDKIQAILSYFNKDTDALEVDIAPNIALDTGDKISVETDLWKNGQRVWKNCVIVEEEIEYNGALRHTMKLHEVNS